MKPIIQGKSKSIRNCFLGGRPFVVPIDFRINKMTRKYSRVDTEGNEGLENCSSDTFIVTLYF